MATSDIGPEDFADFGEFRADDSYSQQAHYIGPLIGYKIEIPRTKTSVDFKLGYYVGISKAAQDAAFRYQLDFDF